MYSQVIYMEKRKNVGVMITWYEDRKGVWCTTNNRMRWRYLKERQIYMITFFSAIFSLLSVTHMVNKPTSVSDVPKKNRRFCDFIY